MDIIVNFDRYCPTIGMCYQINSILEQKGYIKSVAIHYDSQTKQVVLDIVRKIGKKDEKN